METLTSTEHSPSIDGDSFSLIKKDGRWLIASVLNEIPTTDRPIPDVLQEEDR